MLENVKNDTDPALYESAYIFDAFWTAALALNRTQTRLIERNLTLLNFTYDDKHDISDIIYEEALNVTFFGLTVSHRLITHVYVHNNVDVKLASYSRLSWNVGSSYIYVCAQ